MKIERTLRVFIHGSRLDDGGMASGFTLQERVGDTWQEVTSEMVRIVASSNHAAEILALSHCFVLHPKIFSPLALKGHHVNLTAISSNIQVLNQILGVTGVYTPVLLDIVRGIQERLDTPRISVTPLVLGKTDPEAEPLRLLSLKSKSLMVENPSGV